MTDMTAALRQPEARLGEPVNARTRWRTGQLLVAVVVLVIGAQIVWGLITNRRLRWDVVGQYLFSSTILDGLGLTIVLTVASMAIGIVLGSLLALMRISSNPVLARASQLYIWFFRGTPLLVQMLFWAFASAAFPTVSLGIPFGPVFVSWDTNTLISLFAAGLLALGLNEAAYVAEIVRAGIMSVDPGQLEAGQALGMTRRKLMSRIVARQAMRIVIPPLGNATILMLKTTSLVFTIALPELLTSAKIIYGNNFQQIPLLIVASIWYLALTTVLTFLQSRLEKRVGRGFSRSSRKTLPTREELV